MNLDDFILTVTKQLFEFKEDWLARHAINPETNPLDLPGLDDWIEQFLFWDDANNG